MCVGGGCSVGQIKPMVRWEIYSETHPNSVFRASGKLRGEKLVLFGRNKNPAC